MVDSFRSLNLLTARIGLLSDVISFGVSIDEFL